MLFPSSAKEEVLISWGSNMGLGKLLASITLAALCSPAVEAAEPKAADPATGMEFVYVPSGCFQMGDDVNAEEQPMHKVCVKGFYLGKYEVTREQWDAVAGTHLSNSSPDPKIPARITSMLGAKHPRQMVTWNDVQVFIEKLNRMTGKHYRLPTEAEWEYAARAGTTTFFSTGDCITTDQANYNGSIPFFDGCGDLAKEGINRDETTPVGSFSPNGYGLYDMHGNVAEWVEDCYHDSYDGAPSDGSAWTSGECVERVIRGGSWEDFAIDLRSASRASYSSDSRNSNIGFRLIQVIE